jgi:hypothetical protein
MQKRDHSFGACVGFGGLADCVPLGFGFEVFVLLLLALALTTLGVGFPLAKLVYCLEFRDRCNRDPWKYNGASQKNPVTRWDA